MMIHNFSRSSRIRDLPPPCSPGQTGQCHAGEADAELLQRRAARDGLSQTLGEFIEFVVHNFVLVS